MRFPLCFTRLLSENYEVVMYVGEKPGPGQLNESLLWSGPDIDMVYRSGH